MKSLTFTLALLFLTWSMSAQDMFGDLLDSAGKSGLFDSSTSQTLQSAGKVTKAFQKSAEDITPEQEYYIGRSVGANILDQYKPYDNQKANKYLNVLVRILSASSEKPETFGGYHVLILDSDQINAFGAPGGFIFVTRGMLRCCTNETAVAAVLAHEIGHVQFEHGLKAIKQDRLTSAFAVLGTEAAKTYGNDDVKKLTTEFGGSITDIAKTMINNGYSKDLEVQADEGAVKILQGAGYNPSGLIGMFQEMKKRLKPGAMDFAKTHPTPDERIRTVSNKIGSPQQVNEDPAMTARFTEALSGI